MPFALGAIAEPAEWRVATLAALVEAVDLAFVSLWSPTFLIALVEALPGCHDAVAARLSPPGRRRLAAAMRGGALDTATLWPGLACISCWTHGPSAGFAARLGEAFPHAAIDPKGVLATESAITTSWGADAACVPALTSCVVEFLDPAGAPLLCDELAEGETYRAVITTPGGFYRYDIGDLFTCRATRGGVPDLAFVGRAGVTSDLVGEKLEDGFVAAALVRLDRPALLAPRRDGRGYELLVEGEAACAVETVETALHANPQYLHARRMGQLASLRLREITGLSNMLTARGLAAGRRMGDIKACGLLPHPFDDAP